MSEHRTDLTYRIVAVSTVVVMVVAAGVAVHGLSTWATAPPLPEPIDREVIKEIVRSGDGKSSVTARSTKDSVYLHVATDKRSLNLSCVTGVGPQLTLVRNGEVVLTISLDEFGDPGVTLSDRRGNSHGLPPVDGRDLGRAK